jgi:hypothetical protein
VPALLFAEPDVNWVQLKNDIVSYQAAPDTWFYSKIAALGNDVPADKLRIVKVERLMSRGTVHVDRSGTFLNYELNTQNMWRGLSFTDTFRCVCCNSV